MGEPARGHLHPPALLCTQWGSCGVRLDALTLCPCVACALASCTGKLKEMGNSFLGMFGMSLDNFKMDKDPSSGVQCMRSLLYGL